MKNIIFILLLTLVIQISSGQQCQCYQLLNPNDCQFNTKCEWSGSEGCLQKIEQPVIAKDEYCSQFTSTECSGNLRCALNSNQCVRFSGCQSYIGTTDAQCRVISSQCTTDGTICSSKQPCANYSQQLCLTNASSSGSGKCSWNADLLKCQDQTCNDGAYTSDAECNKFIAGCITNGIKCVSVKLFCQQYRGTINTCPQYQGKDGNCKGLKANVVDACVVKKCEDAPSNLNTDQLCSNFQQGCKTTGRGCAMTLPLCSQLVGTLTTCKDLIGRDGKCKGVSNLSYATCTLQDCQDAPFYLKTDQDCSNYIFGCITNGKGCVRQLQSCYSIFGQGNCDGYFGTDGLCENGLKSYCQPKSCKNAPTTYNTDALCKQYQTGCITNGKGCVSKLQPCSSYQGNQISCEGYLGSDGLCKGINSQIQNCVPKLCKDITVASTNAICKTQLPTCVTDGVGCLDQTTCELTKKQISCQGTSGCQWNGICHSSNTCHDYLSLAVCINNTGGPNNLQCFWDDTQLVGFKCRNACQLQDFTSDPACAGINPLCRTNGTGCIDGGLPCSSYKGSRAQCENFMGLNGTIKCANLSTAVTSDVCLIRICTHNTTSTTNTDCGNYLTGCVTNGAGCLPNTEPCTTYKGTQAQCNLFYGQTGTYQCYNDAAATSTTACRNKLCTDISGTTVSACDTQVPGCVTDRTTCVVSTRTCSSFAGTLPQCEILKGNDRRCTKISHFCRDKVCADVTAPTQQSDCTSYLPTCRYVGSGACIDATGCASYTITGADDTAKVTLCQTLTNTTGKYCTFASGTICAEIGTGTEECSYTAIGASDSAKVTYCASFKQATNNRICVYTSGTGKCGIASVCESYTPGGADDNDNTYICQDKLNSSFQTCQFVASAAVCSTSTTNCSYLAYGSTTSDKFKYCTGLQGITSKCTYIEGQTNCVSLGDCTAYVAASGNELVSCQSIINSSGKTCSYTSGPNCSTPASCSDYTAQGASNYQKAIYCYALLPAGGCVYLIGSTTCTPLVACSAYTLVATTTTNDKVQSCALLKNGTGTQGCTYDTGNLCKQATSCSNIKVMDSPYSNCGYPALGVDDASKILYCANYYSSATLVCQFDRSGNCVIQQACTNYSTSSGTDSENNQLCQQLKDVDNLFCTFIDGSSTCGASSSTCAYTPYGTTTYDKIKYCQKFKYGSNFCTYSDLTPNTCSILLTACTNVSQSNYSSCYIQAVGTTTDEYLTYCKQFLDSSGNPCRYSGGFYCMPTQASCTSYISLASTAADNQKICQDHQNQSGYNCIYSSGSNCSEPADNNCTQYVSPASNQEAYCTQRKYSSSSGCGGATCSYLASGTTCSLSSNACSSTGGTDSSSCRQLLSQNGYTCILDSSNCTELSVCSSYTLSGDTVSSYISSCSSVSTSSSCGKCIYTGNSNCDSQPAGCTDITFGSNISTTAEKQEVCQSIKLSSQYCILASSTTACDVSTQCTDYAAYSSDINKNSIICSKYRGGTCRYTGDAQCQNIQTNCSDYLVSGSSDAKKQICQNLTNSSGYNCSYTSGNYCANPLTNCSYTIYGSSTVEKITYCTKLQANSSTNCSYSSLQTLTCITTQQAKQIYCAKSRQNDGQQCSYSSGSTCSSSTTCSDYSYVGDTFQDQINFCQSIKLSNGAFCTQTSLNSSCATIGSCITYQVSGTVNERLSICYNFKNSSGGNCYYFSSSTCTTLTSSTLCPNLQNTGQTSYYTNQQFCNSYNFGSGSCNSSTSSNTVCAAPVCSNFYVVVDNSGSTDDKKLYCSLKYTTVNCYYDTGNFCKNTDVTDCSSYTAAGTAVIDRQYYCNKLQPNATRQCWFLGSDTSTTTCAELSQADKDQLTQYCQVALFSNSSCVYNQTTQLSVCAAGGTCTNMYAYGSTDSEKNNYCLKQLKTLSCVYETGSNCRSKSGTCAYTIYNASTTQEKYQYCQSYVRSSGQNCAFNTSPGTACYSPPSVCAYYAIGTTTSDKIIYCKSLFYSTTTFCTYKTGTTCTQSKICNQQIIPTAYTTAQKITFCQTLINDDSINCTYINSATNCSDPLPDCAYSISSTGTDSQKTTECQTYKSSNGIQCTFQTGLTTCVLTTSCQRFLSSSSSQTCQTNNINGSTCSYTSGNYCSEPLADCTYVAYTADKAAYCSTLKDSFGNYCTYLSGANCSSRVCVSAPSSRVVSDCTTFKSFCTLDTTYQCDNLECSNNTTSTTDTACGTYSLNCLTKNPGCIHRSEPCTSYPGNSTTCQNFKGTNQTILCWVGSSGNCKDRLCTDNTTATTDALCASHIPQPYGSSNPNCVKNQNAGVGCINYGTCASYQGTTTTCWNYLASDGPCKGTNGNTVAACAQRVCAEAPNTYNTHQQCIDYHPTCLSHGLGCTIKATATCDLFLSGTQCVSPLQNCTWASSCRTIQPICQDYTSDGYSTCVNSYSIKSICKWSAAICTFALCEDLNASYNTHQQCQNQNKLCTTSGNGCLTISKCANYSLQACLYAYTPELGNRCTIEGLCRAIKCQDGLFSTTTDCDNFLKGCVTNGKYCVSSISQCSDYLDMNICKNNQCTWVQSNTFQGKCYYYTKCQDIISDNHQYCQLVSTSCTTDGKTCIPITLCSRYTSQISCVTGVDGKCGWQPANKCQLFRMCSDAAGKTLKQCQAFSEDCVSDGVTCMDRQKCRFYSTQLSCESGGTDSTCVWENQLQACRNTLCTDAVVNRTTILGCSQFKAILPCTTNGEQCITLNGSCSAYKTKEFCYKGLLGDCIWDTSCRYKLCRDYQYLTTPECQTIAETCISNGTSCIPQDKCQNYKTKVACYSGGSDGSCTFNGSICKRITQCSDANLDQQTCLKYPNNCYYQNDQCLQITCQSQSFIKCSSYSNFNSTSIIYCQAINQQCTQVTGDQFPSNQCYQNSLYTYTWNQNSSKCEACYPNLISNSSSPNQTNITNQTQSVYSVIIQILLIVIL